MGSAKLRWTDVSLLAGILLLLVGTPGYLAASEPQRTLGDQDTFLLPPLRIGDSASFSLVVSTGDQTVRSPPVLAMRVWPADGASAMHHEIVWDYLPLELDVAGFTYHEYGSQAVIRYDAAGNAADYRFKTVSPTQVGPLEPIDPASRARHSTNIAALDAPTKLGPLDASHVIYRPDAVHRLLGPLEKTFDVSASKTLATDQGARLRAFTAAAYEDRLLLGTQPRQFGPDDAPAASTGGRPRFGDAANNLTLDHPFPNNILARHEPPLWTRAIAWDWLTPELATVAGFHQEWHDANGTRILTIDLVPTRIVPGTTPIPTNPGIPAPTSSLPGTRSPLSKLEDSTLPLHQNLSLAEIRTALERPDTPQQIRDALSDGAYIAEYSFQAGEVLRRGVSVSDKLPPLAPIPTPTDVARGTWLVTLARPTGEIDVAALNVTELLPLRKHEIQVASACPTGTPGTLDPDCTSRPPALTDPRRLVVPPHLALHAMQAVHEAHGHEHATGPEYHYLPLHHISDDIITDPLERHGGRWSHTGVTGIGWHPPAPPNGLASSRGHDPQDRYFLDLDDAAPLVIRQADRIDSGPDMQAAPARQAVPSAAPETIAGLEFRLLASGILLVALSIGLRLWLWLSSGATWRLLTLLPLRLDEKRVLNAPRRRELLELIAARPGIDLRSASRATGAGWGATKYHVDVLRAYGYLQVERRHGRTHLFAGDTEAGDRAAAAVLALPHCRQLLLLVHHAPRQSQGDLAASLGISQPQVSRLLTRLRKADLIQRPQGGGSFTVTERGHQLLGSLTAPTTVTERVPATG